jgi:tetratricopeptide (TPR) repeat protein
VIDREPANADALLLLATVCMQAGKPQPAVELLRRAIALRPGEASFHARLAGAFRQLGQLDQAADCCRQALHLQPGSADFRIDLALILRAQGQIGAAIALLREALQLAPSSPQAHNNLGNALRAQGQKEEALVHFREAVRLLPGQSEMRTNLGQLLLERGEAKDALLHLQEAVRLRPQSAGLHNNLGSAFRELGRFEEARACHARALQLAPSSASTCNYMARALHDEGRLDEAVVWHCQGLQVEPNSAPFLTSYASTLAELDRDEEAARHCEMALRLAPTLVEAWLVLGKVRDAQGRHNDALGCFREVLRLEPNHAAAHDHLGGVLAQLGDFDLAASSYREALRCQPRLIGARARLATLLRGRLPAEEQAALQQQLSDPNLREGSRASLHFGLAHVLDARGQYAEAAEHLQKANALRQIALRQRNKGYDPGEHRQFVDRTIALFTPEFFARVAEFGADSDRPVFVVGLPRSGTTLTEQVLASHSQVHGAGELILVNETLELMPRALASATLPLECLPRLDRPMVQALAGQHLDRLGERNATAARIVDKLPDNYLSLGFIATLFPRARILHCRRDLRDVALSCWMTDFKQINWACDVDHLATRFEQYRRLMAHWREVLPIEILEIDYEEMVVNLEGVARRMVAFCGLDWEPACLEPHKTARPVATASSAQVRQPVHSGSVGRWKKYEQALGELFARVSCLQSAAPAP